MPPSDSPVSISNRALAAIGARASISSLVPGVDQSNAAIQCALNYPHAVAEAFREDEPGFAQRTIAGSLLQTYSGTPPWTANDPASPWQYAYAYPSGCMKVLAVRPQLPTSPAIPEPVRWLIGSDLVNGKPTEVVLSNLPQALIKHIILIDDPSQWEPLFANDVVYRLAYKLIGPLSGNLQLLQANAQKAGATVQAVMAKMG